MTSSNLHICSIKYSLTATRPDVLQPLKRVLTCLLAKNFTVKKSCNGLIKSTVAEEDGDDMLYLMQ